MSTPQTPAAGQHQEIIDQIRAATADSAYQVTPTQDGFDLTLDLADARWWGPLQRAGLDVAYEHHVRLDPARRTFTILDESRRVQWSAGVDGVGRPHVSGSAEKVLGRNIELGSTKQVALNGRGEIETVFENSYDTAEGHRLIRSVLKPAGWSEKMPAAAKGGLIVGLGTLGLLVLAGIVLLILWLTGGLG